MASHLTSAQHCPHEVHIFSHTLPAKTREAITNVTTSLQVRYYAVWPPRESDSWESRRGQEEAYIKKSSRSNLTHAGNW